MRERAPDGLVEVAAQRIVAKELHRDVRAADERPQHPRELCA